MLNRTLVEVACLQWTAKTHTISHNTYTLNRVKDTAVRPAHAVVILDTDRHLSIDIEIGSPVQVEGHNTASGRVMNLVCLTWAYKGS